MNIWADFISSISVLRVFWANKSFFCGVPVTFNILNREWKNGEDGAGEKHKAN